MVPAVAMKALVEEAVVMEMVQQAGINCTMLLILGELNSPISPFQETALDTARPSDIIISSPTQPNIRRSCMHAGVSFVMFIHVAQSITSHSIICILVVSILMAWLQGGE